MIILTQLQLVRYLLRITYSPRLLKYESVFFIMKGYKFLIGSLGGRLNTAALLSGEIRVLAEKHR